MCSNTLEEFARNSPIGSSKCCCLLSSSVAVCCLRLLLPSLLHPQVQVHLLHAAHRRIHEPFFCRVNAFVKGSPSVDVTHAGETLYAAIDTAAHQLHRTLDELKERVVYRRHHPTGRPVGVEEQPTEEEEEEQMVLVDWLNLPPPPPRRQPPIDDEVSRRRKQKEPDRCLLVESPIVVLPGQVVKQLSAVERRGWTLPKRAAARMEKTGVVIRRVYKEDQLCLIIHGEVRLSVKGCHSVWAGGGELVFFPGGTECVWHVLKSPVMTLVKKRVPLESLLD
eukprot:GHVS01081994.1.p1 GENE.GHVS01081994.1~~GHVS01081994.1.p1  ORF type:complete len:279 (-),score=78.03 GHVS01081994.1:458-1294(-)